MYIDRTPRQYVTYYIVQSKLCQRGTQCGDDRSDIMCGEAIVLVITPSVDQKPRRPIETPARVGIYIDLDGLFEV